MGTVIEIRGASVRVSISGGEVQEGAGGYWLSVRFGYRG